MRIQEELDIFTDGIGFLNDVITELAHVDDGTASQKDFFIAEAVAFRLFRNCERFLRAAFLESCTSDTTNARKTIKSKLRCADWETAEEILKLGKPFLDWGNVEATRRNANLIFESGFPITDLIAPIQSDLVDLQRVRNFIAHDSREALTGFEKVTRNHLPASRPTPSSAGELLVSRRRASEAQVLKKLWRKVSALEAIYREL